jgi:hypothetical protein
MNTGSLIYDVSRQSMQISSHEEKWSRPRYRRG